MPTNRNPVLAPETPWAQRAAVRALAKMGPVHSAKIADVAVKLAEICARADAGLSDSDAREIVAAMRRPDGFGPAIAFMQMVRQERYERRMESADRERAGAPPELAFGSFAAQPYGIANAQTFCSTVGPELPRAACKQETVSGIDISHTSPKSRTRRPAISPKIIRHIRENDLGWAEWFAGCVKKYGRPPSWREEAEQFYRMGYSLPSKNQIEDANRKPGKKD